VEIGGSSESTSVDDSDETGDDDEFTTLGRLKGRKKALPRTSRYGGIHLDSPLILIPR
jgi:hypothetical protein